MASSGASDEQMASSGASEHALWNGLVPIVEVAFAHDEWWSMPEDLSRQLYEKYVGQEDASYVWDWGEGGRCGSWAPDGEETRNQPLQHRLRQLRSDKYRQQPQALHTHCLGTSSRCAGALHRRVTTTGMTSGAAEHSWCYRAHDSKPRRIIVQNAGSECLTTMLPFR